LTRKKNRAEIKDLEKYLINPLLSNKKTRKELTDDDINKKNELIQKRKNNAKRQLEEEKRLVIEKILNEDGRKLRERQRKINEENMKKEFDDEEKYKQSLTKIKTKILRNGKIYVRFPQGLLIPRHLKQKPLDENKIENLILKSQQTCQVDNCKNIKKYRDPKTHKFYCSLFCYKKLEIKNF
jgi:hypothetical protein